MADRRLDASALRDWAHTAVGDLITHTDEINRLERVPGRRRRHRDQHAVHHAVGAGGGQVGRRVRRRHRGGRRALRRSAARRAGQLRGHPLADPARSGRRHRVGRRRHRRRAGRHRRRSCSGRRCGTPSGWSCRRWAGSGSTGTIVSVLQAAAEAVEDWRRRRRRPRRRRSPRRRRRGGRARAHPRTARRPGRGRRGRRGRSGPAGAARCADRHRLRSRVRNAGAYEPAPRAVDIDTAEPAPPRFEVMYLLGDCDAGGARAAARAPRRAR